MKHVSQLFAILKASGWSQEQLARELGISFPTLNSWINGRSQPRSKALLTIEELYLTIVGSETIDDATLQATKKAAQKLAMSAKQLTNNKHALDTITLYLTYHTNTIEGSTMTLSDVEEVIFEHKVLSNRTAVEQAEARNHQAAFYWLLEKLANEGKNFRVNEELVLGLHLRLMNGIISDAGVYRRHAVRIMGGNVVLANWQKVPELMETLMKSLNQDPGDVAAELAYSHALFEKIHPFSDGNGRVGRLLMLAQALHAGLTPPLVAKERKSAYYKYLEIAQNKNDHRPLELFIAQSIQYCSKLLRGK